MNTTAGVPKSVAMIKTLVYVMVGLGVVSQILMFVGGMGNAGSLVIAVIGWVLMVWLAMQIEQKKDWARLVVGILAIIGVVAALISVVSLFGTIGLAAKLASMGVIINPVVLGLSAILGLVAGVIDVLIAMNAFKADAVAWTKPAVQPAPGTYPPAPGTPPAPPTN